MCDLISEESWGNAPDLRQIFANLSDKDIKVLYAPVLILNSYNLINPDIEKILIEEVKKRKKFVI